MPKHKIAGAFPKGRYYYSYIPATKSKFGKLPKQKASKYFASLQKAITDAGIVKFLEDRGASRYYIDFVLRFPNSPSPAGWIRHWKDGFMDFGGGFGSALFDGDIEDAYFRADGENRGNLQKMGIRFARDDGTFDTIEDGRITGGV